MLDTYQPVPGRWRAFAVCLVAGFVSLLQVSAINVALPSLQRELGASSSELSWFVSGYALTFGLVLVASGRLGDDYGRKKIFISGLALFTVVSGAAGFAPNALVLVIIRLLQGVAAGVLNPQIAGFVQQLFRGDERGQAFGLFGAIVGVSTAIGPLLGGLLLQAGGPVENWRYIFWVIVPVGLVALALGVRLLPRDETSGERQALDLFGAVLLAGAVVSVMLPLAFAQQGPASAPWWLMGVSAVLLAAFVGWERHAKRAHGQPLVDFAMLRARSYSHGSLLILLYFAGFTSIFFVLTLYYQEGKAYSPLAAGLALVPFAIGSGTAAVIGGRFVPRFGRRLVVAGLLLVVLGLAATIVVLHVDPAHVGWFTAAPLLVGGVGGGLVVAPNQTITLSEVPPDEGSTAAGVLQTGQRVGTAIGIAAVTSLFFGQLTATGGDYSTAATVGLVVTIAFVVLALVVGVVDVRSADRAATSSDGAGSNV